jgi:hypothetical protein
MVYTNALVTSDKKQMEEVRDLVIVQANRYIMG